MDIEYRIEVLKETIEIAENKLIKLQNKNISDLDDFNKSHHDKTIKKLENHINHHKEELDLLLKK